MRFIGRWFVTAFAAAVAIALIPGIRAVGGWVGIISVAFILALVNATVKPIMQALALPLTLLTLGIFYLVVNALVLELASWLSMGIFGSGIYISSFSAAFFGAIIISIVSMITEGATGLGA
ncbi:MAG: phage holin family protein [Coriobacteriales bacterium]|nr:phage holin family protein [Coriobacteriales bacterium]